jgi:phage tail-like protein
MRGLIEDLPSPSPLGLMLPALYQEDDFAQRFISAFDDSLAPIISTLDNLEAYVDPRLAPEDFLDWLSGWVGVVFDDRWSADRRREIVAKAASLHRRRGTLAGIREAVQLVVDGDVEVTDNGGARSSRLPGTALPGTAQAQVTVRVRVADPASVDTRRLSAVVAAVKPAHVPHRVEVLTKT